MPPLILRDEEDKSVDKDEAEVVGRPPGLPKLQWNLLCRAIYLSIDPHSAVSSLNT